LDKSHRTSPRLYSPDQDELALRIVAFSFDTSERFECFLHRSVLSFQLFNFAIAKQRDFPFNSGVLSRSISVDEAKCGFLLKAISIPG